MKKTLFILAASLVLSGNAFAGSGAAHFAKQEWSFDSITAEWEKDKIKRGYTVATQVCMNCHSFKYISHRNLKEVGFSEVEAMAMAAELDIKMNDPLVSLLTAEDAKGAYGKEVPDLSVMNRARAGGADYVYALLTGYPLEVPIDFEGIYYNTVFPGHNIAMPAPLMDDLVEYEDGTPATVQQMAHDVTYFMQWTAEPELLERKKLGVYVLIYLVLFALLTMLLKKRIWRRVKK
jgi:ubiquinol-cytochrome c reductase cytochrome c1 subunit